MDDINRNYDVQDTSTKTTSIDIASGQSMVGGAEVPPKQRKKWMILVVVLLVILLGVGVVFWILMSRTEPELDAISPTESDFEVIQIEEDKTEEGNLSLVKALKLDDSVVQDLFAWTGGANIGNAGLIGLYSIDKINSLGLDYMIGLVMEHLMDQAVLQNAEGDFWSGEGLDLCQVDHKDEGGYVRAHRGAKECFGGGRIRMALRELFGFEGDLTLSSEKPVYNGESVWWYDIQTDEAYFDGGKTGSSKYYRALYEAEKDDERLYLYEVVVVPDGWLCGGLDEADACVMRKLDGTEVVFGTGDVGLEKITAKMLEQKSELDRFKWTFRMNDAGNYVFEGLERV